MNIKMENKAMETLECSRQSLFKHFAKDCSTLTCGHLICKECLPTYENESIKCDLCGETNQIKIEYLKQHKEPLSNKFLFDEHIKNIYQIMEERFKESFEQFKEIHSKEYINQRIDLMKEEIEIKVESLMNELELLREKLFEQVEGLKNKIYLEMDTQQIAKDMNEYEKFIKRLQIDDKKEQIVTRDALYECQDALRKIVNDNKNYLKINFSTKFTPSKSVLDIGMVGSISKEEKIMDSLILNEDQKKELFKLCNFPKTTSYQLLYRATRDGFGSNDFHRLCDNYAKTLVVIKSKNNYIFGGYTSQTWNHTGNYKNYVDEFLFSLTNPSGSSCKISNNGYGNYGIYCNSNYGPTFGGGHDLHICSNSNSSNKSYSSLGNSYNGSTNYLIGSSNFYVSEIEVYKLE